jgi:hypothetical protein
MKTYKASQAPGFFDVELRVQWLLTKGNSLSRLDAVIDWESFRPLLEAALRVKLLPQDGEVYVLAHSGARAGKERGMRQRKLKAYWKRLGEVAAQELSRDERLQKLGAGRLGWCGCVWVRTGRCITSWIGRSCGRRGNARGAICCART